MHMLVVIFLLVLSLLINETTITLSKLQTNFSWKFTVYKICAPCCRLFTINSRGLWKVVSLWEYGLSWVPPAEPTTPAVSGSSQFWESWMARRRIDPTTHGSFVIMPPCIMSGGPIRRRGLHFLPTPVTWSFRMGGTLRFVVIKFSFCIYQPFVSSLQSIVTSLQSPVIND